MTDRSRGRLFFDEALAKEPDTFSFLAALINGGEDAAENGWRDYKEAGFIGRLPKPGEDKQRVKELWSNNLSAFANTGGGVLLWGFHTTGKIPDKLSLAPDCALLADWLTSLTIDATNPHVAGVEVKAVKDPNDAKAGIVICYIPASTFAPHQAQWGERAYFIRAQDSNVVCPPPLLRNLFFPRAQSRLQPIVKMTASKHPRGGIHVVLEAHIASLGPATAEVAMISFEAGDIHVENVSFDAGWKRVADNTVMAPYPLPPNFVSPLQLRARGVLLSSGASMMFRFFAHNTPVHHATVNFSQEEVLGSLTNQSPIEKRARSEPIYP